MFWLVCKIIRVDLQFLLESFGTEYVFLYQIYHI